MRRLRVSALAAAVAVVALPGTPASAAPDPSLCAYDASRGAVPEDFAIDACVDGTSVVLRNDLDFPVVAEVEGASEPEIVRRADGPRSTLVRLVVEADVTLLPGDVVRWPLTDGPAQVLVSTAEPGVAPAMADSLRQFLPDPSAENAPVYSTVATLVRDLVPAVAERAECMADRNWLQVAACDVTTARTVAETVSAQLDEPTTERVLPVALDRELWGRWAQSRPPGLRESGDKSVVLTQSAVPGSVEALPPWAAASVLGGFAVGLPAYPALAATAAYTCVPGREMLLRPLRAGGGSVPHRPPAAPPGTHPPSSPVTGEPAPAPGPGPGAPPAPAPAPAPAPRPAPEPEQKAAPKPQPSKPQPSKPQNGSPGQGPAKADDGPGNSPARNDPKDNGSKGNGPGNDGPKNDPKDERSKNDDSKDGSKGNGSKDNGSKDNGSKGNGSKGNGSKDNGSKGNGNKK